MSLLKFDNSEEKPAQSLFTQKQASFGVTPNDVNMSRLNEKIRTQERQIEQSETQVTKVALKVQRTERPPLY